MNRLALALVLATTTACSTNPGPAVAQSPSPVPGDPPRTLTVGAHATVERTPDVAIIQLAVETLAGTAGEASERNAAAMESVLQAVRDRGIPRDRIRTQRLELQPRYRGTRDEEPEIVAYRAVNQVTVTVDDVSAVGEVVDAAVRAGANRVTGIQFELADPESAYHEALRRAVERARTEAEVMASALGVTLGEPLQVSTGGFSVPVGRGRLEAMAMDRSGAPPVEPGEVEVRAHVNIVWRLGT